MSVPMSLEYSAEALMEFLDYIAKKRLANKNTIASRKGACSKMFEVLEPGEASDLRELDIEDLSARFNNLRGAEYSPQSLQVYKSRLTTAVSDFLRYKADPAGFRPVGGAAKKPKSPAARKQRDPMASSQGSVNDSGAGGMKARPEADACPELMDVPIAIRPNLIVRLAGVPFDLSRAEAEKISAVVKAMGAVYDE